MKRFTALVVILSVLVTICTQSVYGHNTLQEDILEAEYHEQYKRYCIGGESIGWSIDEDCHSNSTTIEYHFVDVSGLTQRKTRFGVAKWLPVVTFTETQQSGGYICEYDFKDSRILAGFFARPGGIESATGHITDWQIDINSAMESYITDSTIAHEFGHVIGLNDLYDESNKGKMMYGYNTGYAFQPTDADLWGAKVILGIHTTHNFSGYRLWTTDANGNNYHVQYCTDCNGNSATHSMCFYGFPNISLACLVCGIPSSQTIN